MSNVKLDEELALEFNDIKPIAKKIGIDGVVYFLLEASEDVAVTFRNAAFRGARFSEGKIAGIDNPADMEPLLVSMCLCYSDDMPDGVGGTKKTIRLKQIRRPGMTQPVEVPDTVPIQVIKSWPSRVVKPIFDLAKKISHLDDADGDTVEGLNKQILELQEKRQKLLEGKTPESHAKNSP